MDSLNAQIDWDKEYVVTIITRQDLKEAGWSDAQIADITDSDMERIASRVDDVIRGDDFLDIVNMQTHMVLEWGNSEGTGNER